MNITSDQLKEAGYDVVDGKAVRRGTIKVRADCKGGSEPDTFIRIVKSEGILVSHPNPALIGTKAGKYGNTPTRVDGWRFDSKKEARRYEELKLLKLAGHVLWFTCQVPFRLPGHTKYIADFEVHWKIEGLGPCSTGHGLQQPSYTTIEDVKSPITRNKETYRLKKRMMLEIHGIEITEV